MIIKEEFERSIRYNQEYEARLRRRWGVIKKVARKLSRKDYPYGVHVTVSQHCITFLVPYEVKCISAVRKHMGKGWKLADVQKFDDGSISRHYMLKGASPYESISVRIVLDADKLPEGSCKKVLIDQHTQTIDVYEVICS